MSGYGYFGNMAEHYDKTRLPYSKTVVDYCRSLVGAKNVTILDLGCGTGISSRQLAGISENVVGCDTEEKMVRVAIKHKSPTIKYTVGRADCLPFRAQSFHAVTVFAAFHWFSDTVSVSEIRRTLKKKGFFIAVNRYQIGGSAQTWGKIREIIQSATAKKRPNAKEKYAPQELLILGGFESVEEKIFCGNAIFTVSRMIQNIMATSIFNEVLGDSRANTLLKLENYLKSVADLNGIIEWPLETRVVSGVKQ